MWLAVQEQPPAEEAQGVANQRRVSVQAPTELKAPEEGAKLEDWSWQQSEMSTDLAVKLGFAVGSTSASYQSRTLISEFSRSTTVEQDDGSQIRWGVAARLVVGATKFDATAQLSIPVLAAEGSLGRSRATVSLTVRGYFGDELAALMPTDIQTLNVDTYSALTTKMDQIVKLIGSDHENIKPALLGIQAKDEGPAEVEPELSRSVAITYALTELKDGTGLEEALSRYHDADDPIAQQAIRDVYRALGEPDGGAVARAKATQLLDDYVIKAPFLSRL
jgi:hypothetical protein